MRHFCLILLALGPWCHALGESNVSKTRQIVIQDDLGRTHRFLESPKRVVSLAPSQTEIMFHLGEGRRLVGRTESCNYPKAAKEIPSLGHVFPPRFESIIAMKPDVVLMMSGMDRIRLRLEKLGIKVVVSQPKHVADIARHIERFGTLFDVESKAKAIALRFKAKLEEIARHHGTAPMRVFYEVWARPLTTAGPQTFLSDVIRIAGGQSLFSDVQEDWPRVSREAVVYKDPEAVLVLSTARKAAWLNRHGPWSVTTAAKTQAVFVIPDSDLLARPGPRIIDGIRWLQKVLRRQK